MLLKKNNALSKIATVGGIDNSTDPVTFAVTTGEGSKFPASNFLISIDNEILLCTSRTGDNLTCARAKETTTIAAHSQNADVENRITSGTLEEYEDIVRPDGWIIPRSSFGVREAWAYASPTTITVPTGAASRHQKGDKIKLTQTTVKYFYIIGVADTVLTITGGSDYTLANAAITDNYYSHQANPIGFPFWFNYAPTYGGFSAAPANAVARFYIDGTFVVLEHREPTAGTSNATNFTITLPVTSATITNMLWIAPANCTDAGTLLTTPSKATIGSNDTLVTLYKDYGLGAWTNSGDKRAGAFTIIYEI